MKVRHLKISCINCKKYDRLVGGCTLGIKFNGSRCEFEPLRIGKII